MPCANETLSEEEVDDEEDNGSTIDKDLSRQSKFIVVGVSSPGGTEGAGERSDDTEGW